MLSLIHIYRPLYDWVIENCPVPARPRQPEFARLNLTSVSYTHLRGRWHKKQ